MLGMMFFGLVVGFELALVMSFSSLSAYKWDLHVFDLPPFDQLPSRLSHPNRPLISILTAICQLDNNNFSGAEIPISYGNLSNLVKL
ncbi:hypothetical protein CK203_047851 [Vitis vinifera]|uniref:Uncharacterized protein n=1 Tax=Vitis vinifera TaxID=29760 RepID=A0A438H8D0_VITVI|nr:hypothetical protein CK203_047851 [Vitis vinifera]